MVLQHYQAMQTDNNQSVTVNGRIVNSATDGGESVQTISGKKSAVVNGYRYYSQR